MLAAIFCVWFGLSLLPGREPLCLRFARKVSGGIMPDGAEPYCRRLTRIWFYVLGALTVVNVLLPGAMAVTWIVVPALLLGEHRYRGRRFAVTFHTSGTTGSPKTIVKPFECLAKEVAYHRDTYRAAHLASCTFLSTVDPDHMYGMLWRVMLPKALGCMCDESVIRSPEELLAKMSGPVFLVTTPAFLSRFVRYAEQYTVPKTCVEITTSGSLLTPEVERRTFEVFGVHPRQIYGSTETGGIAAIRVPERTMRIFGPVKAWRRKDGHLAVKSPFSWPHRYVLGDLVDESLNLLGRADRLVKINEERLNLAEYEAKAAAVLGGECALVALAGKNGDILGLVSTAVPLKPLEARAKLVNVFPKGTVPKRFRFVTELPRNDQGKVVSRDIAALF